MTTVMKFELNIDWAQLNSQKQALLRAAQNEEELDGIVHLIDSIQDQAVENGIKDDEVFGHSPQTII